MTIKAGAASSALALSIATAVILATVAPQAQFLVPPTGPPVDPTLQFEAASVKASEALATGARMMMMPGRFEASGVPLRGILRQALRAQDYQLVGVPDWVNTERYSIVAKAPEGAPPNAIPTMLLNLFKDRFALATHTETRQLPVYNLVLARSDGRLGRSFTPSSAECQATIKARAAGPGPGAAGPGAARGPDFSRGAPPPPTIDPDKPPCGFMRQGPGIANGGGASMAQIVQMLSQSTGLPVIDKTGLSGYYDINLKFQPEAGPNTGLFGPPPPGGQSFAVDPDAANIFTAVQEQLGLKLESVRGPVDVIVIDRIEKPTLD
jgi:uncharacterized protein (TIGR03435 family)